MTNFRAKRLNTQMKWLTSQKNTVDNLDLRRNRKSE